MSLRRQDIDTLLAPGYLEGLELAGVDEVRRRRDECQRAEVVLSYLRRVMQGELDLVIAELDLRATGSRGDVGRLVEELPAILGASRSVSISGSPAEVTVRFGGAEPSPPERGWQGNEDAILDELIGEALDSELADSGAFRRLPGANLGTFTDAELSELVERMRDDEASLSAQRRQLHERIDVLQAEIIERYKTGAATVDALLQPAQDAPSAPPSGKAAEGSSA